ncbi:MAG TPA: hypothetical protein VKQ36_12340 [Ktedonobacterales bacterium]|nr:hypothetical protein [Ktedonobacterales bacterium]
MHPEIEQRRQHIQELLLSITHPSDPQSVPAYRALLQENPISVAQSLVEWLWDQGLTHSQWSYDVEGFCWQLGRDDGKYLAHLCAPTLASILNLHIEETDLDPGLIISVFQRIGIQQYPYLIPALIDVIRRNRRPEYVEVAWEALQVFDEEALAPYQLIIAQLPSRQ